MSPSNIMKMLSQFICSLVWMLVCNVELALKGKTVWWHSYNNWERWWKITKNIMILYLAVTWQLTIIYNFLQDLRSHALSQLIIPSSLQACPEKPSNVSAPSLECLAGWPSPLWLNRSCTNVTAWWATTARSWVAPRAPPGPHAGSCRTSAGPSCCRGTRCRKWWRCSGRRRWCACGAASRSCRAVPSTWTGRCWWRMEDLETACRLWSWSSLLCSHRD